MSENQILERLESIRNLMDSKTHTAIRELDWLVVEMKQKRDEVRLDKLSNSG